MLLLVSENRSFTHVQVLHSCTVFLQAEHESSVRQVGGNSVLYLPASALAQCSYVWRHHGFCRVSAVRGLTAYVCVRECNGGREG